MRPRRLLIRLLRSALLIGAAQTDACSVPGYRYALEPWEADQYDLYVCHDGKLTDEEKKLTEWFENQGLIEYNEINDELLTLLQHQNVREGMRLTEKQKDNLLQAL